MGYDKQRLKWDETLGEECAAEMGISAHIKAFGFSKVLDYLERDPDANLPRLMEWVDRFTGEKLPQHYRELFRSAMSDPENNWYRLIKSMYTDIDSRVLKKLFENFVLNGNLLDWPQKNAEGGWPEGGAPWSVLIDPTFPCDMGCKGCGSAIYGVRPVMEFDSLDEEIDARKAGGTYLYIFPGGDPLSREQEIIALCNKHSGCVFAAFTPPESITGELAEDMLRVGNLFPAIQADQPTPETERAMALMRRARLPFGVACRCTAENAGRVAEEGFLDQIIASGAKFCWFFTCPAFGPEEAPSGAQLARIHRQVQCFRRSKPLLTLDFWDGPSPAAMEREKAGEEGEAL